MSKIEDKRPLVKYITMAILSVLFALAFMLAPECNAQEITKSEWIESQSIELPAGLEIKSGITRNGNPKYWFEIEGIKIFISPTNKEHYINNTATILLVEWYNKSKDTYKYTTRQKKTTKKAVKLNLDSLF